MQKHDIIIPERSPCHTPVHRTRSAMASSWSSKELSGKWTMTDPWPMVKSSQNYTLNIGQHPTKTIRNTRRCLPLSHPSNKNMMKLSHPVPIQGRQSSGASSECAATSLWGFSSSRRCRPADVGAGWILEISSPKNLSHGTLVESFGENLPIKWRRVRKHVQTPPGEGKNAYGLW